MLSEIVFPDDDSSHEQLFGHLSEAEFTAAEAAEYLEVSIPTFRRYVQGGSSRNKVGLQINDSIRLREAAKPTGN